jgi:hypothetical protein
MSAAWMHNAQGEIHQDGAIDWGYLLLIGFSWFFPAFIVSGLLGYLFIYFGRHDTTDNRRAEQVADGKTPDAPQPPN